MNKIKLYYQLTKPGIIYGNLLTALGGFLLASKDHIHFSLLILTLLGTSLVIGSACVFNNYIDRGIDQKMARTKKRALVTGLIPFSHALFYGLVLGVIGLTLLIFYTNYLVVIIGSLAFINYVVFYGLAKRRSIHGTLVGSFSGSAPIVAGYCAVTNSFNTTALLLFILMIAWQMAHFYAIAIYRIEDYRAAKIPVLPIVKGLSVTRYQILAYISVFSIVVILLTTLGHTGYVLMTVLLLVSLWWLRLGFKGLKQKDLKVWARKMFLFSLIVVLVLSLMLSANTLLS